MVKTTRLARPKVAVPEPEGGGSPMAWGPRVFFAVGVAVLAIASFVIQDKAAVLLGAGLLTAAVAIVWP